MTPRRDQASLFVAATSERLWKAWMMPVDLVRWLPPPGISPEDHAEGLPASLAQLAAFVE